MVHISDLIKKGTPPPASKSDDREDGVRLSNLSELITGGKKTPPAKADPHELPHRHPDRQAEIALERHQEASREKPPEFVSANPEAVPERPSEQEAATPSDGRSLPNGKTLYFNAQRYLQEVKERMIAGRPITIEQPLGMIEQMIAVPSLIDEMYQLTLAFGHGSDMWIASPVNSMIYCFKIGVRMDYTPSMLTEICLAALHHDIGMFLIPDAIIRNKGKLTAAAFSEMKKHTETGRDLFMSHDLNYPNVGRAIYEHHERENGQGYPSGLKGDEISEYAKIIGICDSYEAMTHDRPHKKAAAQYSSVLQLAGSKDLLFSPNIVKIFLDEITLYPIGSYVRLNNKALCIVVGTNPNNPMKPTVRIVMDGHGKRVTEERLINLAENTILTIVAGIPTDEIPA